MRKITCTISMVLCVALLITAAPISVWAESNPTPVALSQSNETVIAVGDYITLGTYLGEPIVWCCVDIDENGPLMLSEKILCNKAYDANGQDSEYHSDGWGYIRKKYGSNCWSDSSIRQWLNTVGQVDYTHCPPSYADENGFLSNFSSSELSLVKTVTQKSYLNEWETHRTGYVDGGTREPSHINDISKLNDDTSSYWYQNVTDKFFLLERNQLYNIYENNPAYLYADETYFTRYVGNAGASYENIFGVGTTGNFTYCAQPCAALGIRPAFYLNMENYRNTEEVADRQSIEQYMTDIILNHNYLGCLSGYCGSSPQNFMYNYLLHPEQVSLSRVYVDLLYSNREFQDTVLAWEIATFEPSDILYQNALDEVGYYEAVIMNVLNCAVENSIVPSAVKDAAKTATDITEGVYQTLEKFASMDYEKLSNQPWSLFDVDTQYKAIQAAAGKCTALNMRSSYVSEFSNLMSTSTTVKEFCEKIASIEQVAKMDESVSNVLNYLYNACPDDNTAMKTAIYEIRAVCNNGFEKATVELLGGITTVTSMAADKLVDKAWEGYVIASLGTSLGSGVLIGQLIGKTLSDFLFSTDANIEQYYAMRALVQFENVMVNATTQSANQYKGNGTTANAVTFLTSVKMLISTYGLSCDYAEKYTEIVKVKGLVNGVKSLFGFGNEQEYETFRDICRSMKGNLSVFERCLADIMFGYADALQYDDNDMYQRYMDEKYESGEYWKSKVITVACPTNVDVYQNGCKVASVISNEIVGLTPGVAICIDNNVKNIVLPANGDYTVNIIGTDAGTMDYTVSEYASGKCVRGVNFDDVPLTKECMYSTTVLEKTREEIVLIDDNSEIITPDFDSTALTFKGASLALQHNLAINYKVDKALFEDVGYTEPYVEFELNGVKTKASRYTVSGDRYVFTFKNIAPNQMNDTIKATLYATYNGVEYTSATREYSVAEYCYSMLDLYAADEYAELRTLLADLLNYGAASQIYTGYGTDNLVDAKLTEVQRLWGTSADPTMDTVLNATYKTVENPLATWKGAGLNLQDSVSMRLKFTAEHTDGLSVKIESGTSAWTISSDRFVEENGAYYVCFSGLDASQMRQSVYLTIYDGDTPVSNTVCYSIGSYAYEKQNSTIDGLSELVKAMMKYGDSAYAYVH